MLPAPASCGLLPDGKRKGPPWVRTGIAAAHRV